MALSWHACHHLLFIHNQEHMHTQNQDVSTFNFFFQVNKIHDPLNVANHYNMALAWIKRLERFHLRLVYLYHMTLPRVKVILVSDHLLTDKHIIHTILHLTTVTSLSQNSSEWHLEAMLFHKNINHLGFCFTQLEILSNSKLTKCK